MDPAYWENGHAPHPVKYESEAAVSSFPYCTESSLNFSTSATAYSEDDADYSTGRRNKTSRQDPLSHRIIEKRRRDRMNSCLADLSRLIPPQYQRKGRGRIEKTEIIEMAIRHLKHLQNECIHKEYEYKVGYNDCMKEAAKFLYDSHMQDFCYRLVAHLQEHCDEVVKNECQKNRCPADNVSASSGSPHNNFHPTVPLSHLRDMLVSDVDHSNSNDLSDIKDLSFRSQPHQAAVITSTAPLSLHHDSSNHDFDSSREPMSHHESDHMHSPPHTQHSSDNILRLRNYSESSHDIEHNNNNYKYKNHIKERFNQDHLHDETTSDHCIVPIQNSSGSISEHSSPKDDLDNPPSQQLPTLLSTAGNCKKRRLINDTLLPLPTAAVPIELKPPANFSEIKTELSSNAKLITNGNSVSRHLAVPIFALHGQGTYYVPLNIEYEALLPYLNGIDLLDKNFCPMSVLHPVNINVNFNTPTLMASNNKQINKSKLDVITNGW